VSAAALHRVRSGSPRRAPTVALASAIALSLGGLAHADGSAANAARAPRSRVLLSDAFWRSDPFEADTARHAERGFGIRKGRGLQLMREIELDDRDVELSLSGPIVKTGSKRKYFGLSFEVRF
jgi:hypothetical protein